ncbi:MAG: hypothetical protein DI629_12130 [Mesorhizobium amorphae]|nr:MAG: hypothetical protein DI629_12130 [Mesorhizobium amorphae]
MRDKVLAATDRLFAEPVKLSFLKGGVVDTSRPAVEIEAILRVEGENSAMTLKGSAGSGWAPIIEAGKAELHINRATYAGPPLRVGDRVKALSRSFEPWFEVSSVDDRTQGRIVARLNNK